MDGVREICRLARKGNVVAVALAWHGGTQLAQCIEDIAGRNPEWLEKIASSETYMPSVLSSSTSFNNKRVLLPESLGLAHSTASGSKSNLRLDSPTTQLVVECFEQAERTRQSIQHFARMHKMLRPKPKQLPKLEDYLLGHLGFEPSDLPLKDLDALSEQTFEEWWRKVFEPWLEDWYWNNGRTLLHKELKQESEDRKVRAETNGAKTHSHHTRPLALLKQKAKSALHSLARRSTR
jgi:hypothetical protein